MAKKSLCILLCVCLLGSISGCADKEPSESEKEEFYVEIEKPKPEDEQDSSSDVFEEEIPLQPFTPDLSVEALQQETDADNALVLETANWDIMGFSLLTQNYRLPFSYARLSEYWKFNIADYGLDDSFVLQPNERTTASVILTNPLCDYTLVAGFYNPYDVEISLDESMIWSISVNMEDSTISSPVLPSGITYGSSLQTIARTYGDPSLPLVHDLEKNTFEYTYLSGHQSRLILIIHDTKGLIEFTLQYFGPEK